MDLASLALAVDSRDVKAGVSELDRLTAAGGKAETATASMGREWVKASSAAGKLRMEEASAAMAAERMAKASGGAGAAAAKMARDTQVATASVRGIQAPMQAVTTATGAQRAGMQQLSMQLGNMATMFAMGARPMQIFASQSGQVIQAVQLMAGGTSRFAAFLGGPWGIALTAAAMVLVPLIGNLGNASKATEDLREAEKRLASSIGALISSREALDVALGRNSQNYVTLRIRALEAAQAELTAAQKSLQAAQIRLRTAQADRQMRDAMVTSGEAGAEGGYLAGLFGFGRGAGAAAVEVKNSAADLMQASATLNNATADLRKALTGGGAKMDTATAAVGRHSGAVNGAAKAYAAASREAEEFNRVIEQITRNADATFNDALGQAMERTRAILEGNTNVDWNEMLRAANDNLDKVQKPIRDAADAQAEWNDRLQETIGFLKQIGGIGGTLGAVLGAIGGLATGDFSAVGGKAGAMLQSVMGMQWKDSSGTIRKFGEEMNNALKDVFGDGFGEKLLGAFQGAGMGLGIGSIVGGGSKMAQLGGALGGAAGQAIGSSIAALGSAGGPIGSIVGALAGALLGGLLAKTPKASATIGVSGGALGIAGVSGNSNSRKAASTQGANTAIDALNTIAEAFGATLGTANVSIGMRKNSYVVDTTGSGKTKGAGVLNFGKDSEAALKAAIADAISDGVFVGLSAGVEKLLKNGDVEKQLQKALSFQAVFDDLSSAKDPAKAAQDAIGKWHDSMAKIFEEAGATADELAKLEELTGIKRADAAKAAADALLEKERPYREAQIQIMQLEGKTAEALAASRQLELDGMEEGLRPLYQRIYALTDEAEAAQKLADIAAQRHELETQLLEILDPVAGALVRQNDALMALDPSLRDAQQAVWDAKSAFDAAAESAKAAADAIKEAFEKVQANLDQRRAMTIQLAELLDPAAAEAMRRADILRALEDPILQGIQRMIWDVGAGIDAAAKSAADLKEQTEAWQRTLDQRRSLTIQLADILDPAAAEAMRRADTLNAIADPDSRRIQQQIFDAMDAQKLLAEQRAEQDRQAAAAAEAEQARLKAVADARNVLIAAYDRESGALQGTIDRFRGFAESITAFRESIIGQANPGAGYGRTLAQFRSTSAMAGLGSENALGRFNGDAQALLDAAKDRAGSGAEYRRIQAMVLAGANSAIGASSGVANMAQQQLDTMKAQLEGLIDLNEGQTTFTEALEAYRAVAAEQVPVLVDTVSNGLETLRAEVAAGNATAQQAQQTAQVAQDTSALALVRIERLLSRVTTDDAVRITSDDTISVDQVA